MSQSISNPEEKTLSRRWWKKLSRVGYPKIIQSVLQCHLIGLWCLQKSCLFMWNWETWEKLGREETLGKYEVVGLRSSWEAHRSKLEGAGFAESVRKQWALLPLKPLKARCFERVSLQLSKGPGNGECTGLFWVCVCMNCIAVGWR